MKELKKMKINLKRNELLMKVDFSENYECKLAQEIKERHYPGAKKQISIHSGVMYYLNEDKNVDCKSFATVTENKHHDAASVWGHLKPIFEFIKSEFPHVDTVHIQSDGPVSQYKNQSNFYLFYYYSKIFGFKKCTWNFSGSGHGKSEADGSGAVVKQQSDRGVARGNDIESAEQFVNLLQAANCKVIVMTVPVENFIETKEILQQGIHKPIKESNRVHQVIYEEPTPGKASLRFRYLTCQECGFKKCTHFELLGSAVNYLNKNPRGKNAQNITKNSK